MARYGIDAFDVKLDTTLQLNSSRVEAQEDVYSLVIGAGGTGLDALLETKGLINKTCCLDSSHKHLPTDHVVYRGFDTDNYALTKVSSKETGGAALDAAAGEFVQMQSPSMAHFLSEAYRSQVPAYIRSWLDFTICPSTGSNGAGCIRQCGRLLLFQNIDTVRNSITSAISGMIAGRNVSALNIYLLTGIGGGTGSGTFIDLAYISRDVAENIAPGKVTMYGYLFMPDVNLSRPMPDENKAYIRKNGYAALKELDYLMNMSEDGGKFVQQYSPSYAIDTERQPFNYVHLIGSAGSDGLVFCDPYRQSMRAVAQSIVSFVVDGCNFDSILHAAPGHTRRFPERYNTYLALGTYSYELPIDQILLYVTSLLFEKMDSMFDAEPDQDTIERSYSALGLAPKTLLSALAGEHAQLAPAGAKWEDLFGKNPKYNLSGLCGAWINRTTIDIETRAKAFIENFPADFKRITETWFTDPSRGPIWINHLIVLDDETHAGLIARLRRDFATCGSQITATKTEVDKMWQVIRAMAQECKTAPALFGGREQKTTSYIEMMDRYADLCAKMVALQHMQEVYDKCLCEIADQNDKMFKVVVEVLEGLKDICRQNLKDICRQNADILTHTELDASETHFTWQPIRIPDVSDAIKEAFDARGDAAQTISSFTNALLDHACEWSEGRVDVKGFICDYLDSNFSDIANGSLEEYVKIALKGDDLQNSVIQTLVPNSIKMSVPLFPVSGTADVGHKFWLVSIPRSCREILQAYRSYKAADAASSKTLTIQLSGINSRIFAQSILGAVPLSAYAPLLEYELAYLNPHYPHWNSGIHLYMGKDVNWRDLPSPIPWRARPRQLNAYPAQIKQAEDEARSVFEKCRAFPIIRVVNDGVDDFYVLHIAQLPEDLEEKYGDAAMKDDSGHYDAAKLRTAVERLRAYLKYGLPDIALTDEIHHSTYTVAVCRDVYAEWEKREETARECFVGEYNNQRRAQLELEKYTKIQEYLNKLDNLLAGIDAVNVT